MREHNGNLDPAAGAQHLERHIIAVPTNAQIDTCRTKLQLAKDHFVKERRQAWVAQANFAASRVEFEPAERDGKTGSVPDQSVEN